MHKYVLLCRYDEQHPLERVCNSTLSEILDSEQWSVEVRCSGGGKESEKACDPRATYRSIDGSCNNLHRRRHGAALTAYRRGLPPRYADGVSEPRGGFSSTLPSALAVSRDVHRPVYREDGRFTVMLAVWGQFLDHDITATAASRTADGVAPSCCGDTDHPDCFPVIGPTGECMEFVRSAPAPDCCLGPREQLNQQTSYIDGSVVYGAELKLAKALRNGNGGRLRALITSDGRELLPQSTNARDGCNRAEEAAKGRYCFLSGDPRSNENLHLTSMHVIWARHHNRLATSLAELNPSWDDERLYEETRRIVAAQMQHITYAEFLPAVLGEAAMRSHQLWLGDGYPGYDPMLDVSIANEFAAAAFRFAHTLIPPLVHRLANDTSSEDYIQMRRMLFDPYELLSSGALDAALAGAVNTPAQAADTYFAEVLKTNLFADDEELERNAKMNYVSFMLALPIHFCSYST